MGGMTTGPPDMVEKEGYGRVADKGEAGDAVGDRTVEGYGGSKDMDRNIGA